MERALVIMCYVSDESDERKKRIIRDKVGLCHVVDIYMLILLWVAYVWYSQNCICFKPQVFTIRSIECD